MPRCQTHPVRRVGTRPKDTSLLCVRAHPRGMPFLPAGEHVHPALATAFRRLTAGSQDAVASRRELGLDPPPELEEADGSGQPPTDG